MTTPVSGDKHLLWTFTSHSLFEPKALQSVLAEVSPVQRLVLPKEITESMWSSSVFGRISEIAKDEKDSFVKRAWVYLFESPNAPKTSIEQSLVAKKITLMTEIFIRIMTNPRVAVDSDGENAGLEEADDSDEEFESLNEKDKNFTAERKAMDEAFMAASIDDLNIKATRLATAAPVERQDRALKYLCCLQKKNLGSLSIFDKECPKMAVESLFAAFDDLHDFDLEETLEGLWNYEQINNYQEGTHPHIWEAILENIKIKDYPTRQIARFIHLFFLDTYTLPSIFENCLKLLFREIATRPDCWNFHVGDAHLFAEFLYAAAANCEEDVFQALVQQFKPENLPLLDDPAVQRAITKNLSLGAKNDCLLNLVYALHSWGRTDLIAGWSLRTDHFLQMLRRTTAPVTSRELSFTFSHSSGVEALRHLEGGDAEAILISLIEAQDLTNFSRLLPHLTQQDVSRLSNLLNTKGSLPFFKSFCARFPGLVDSATIFAIINNIVANGSLDSLKEWIAFIYEQNVQPYRERIQIGPQWQIPLRAAVEQKKIPMAYEIARMLLVFNRGDLIPDDLLQPICEYANSQEDLKYVAERLAPRLDGSRPAKRSKI